MGQTPSKDQQFTDLYSSYIQQQQNLIYQQQRQINDLFTHNLEAQQQQPANMFFQSDMNQQKQQSLPQLPSARPKLDPYKILGIPKQYDETILRKAYLKKAMKAHPDRGGSKKEFQKVSIAYTVLKKKLKEQSEIHHHDELKSNAKSFIQSQPTQHIDSGDNFDVKVFNKIYGENRIEDSYDKGYGTWMNETPSDTGDQKMFQGEFNKDMFNATFEKYKHEQSQRTPQNQLALREPDVRISMSNQDSLMTLGQDKITNFGGQTGNLGYTDYKQAFTDGSTLIDTSTVDVSGRTNSMRGMKAQRSNISYTMTQQDEQKQALLRIEEQTAEQNRLQRVNKMDQRQADSYEKIHSMLLR